MYQNLLPEGYLIIIYYITLNLVVIFLIPKDCDQEEVFHLLSCHTEGWHYKIICGCLYLVSPACQGSTSSSSTRHISNHGQLFHTSLSFLYNMTKALKNTCKADRATLFSKEVSLLLKIRLHAYRKFIFEIADNDTRRECFLYELN